MEEQMKNILKGCLYLMFIAVACGAGMARADDDDDRNPVRRFATLPAGPGHPEGIAADRAGNIYVATFEFSTPNVIHVFGRHGHLRLTIPLPGTVPLGMEFDSGGRLYLADFGNGRVLQFTPPFTAASTPSAVFPVCGGPGAGCGLNAITFDAAGDLYVSDSFGGNVFKIDLPGGVVSNFFAHDLLKPGSHGFPPFGANGLVFDTANANLYIANTADDRILKLNIASNPYAISVFAESINGADGIAFDKYGRLWVSANQADEVVALNASGRVVARIGEFEGIRRDGSPKGLLFPASLVIVDDEIFVTNLALPLTAAVGDEPEEDVTRYTISRMKVPHD
jgi:DNA-binding beta-propeller fold protein YncE